MSGNFLRFFCGLPAHDVKELKPDELTDPVAARTQWTFLSGGDEGNFCMRTLKKVGEGRLEFWPSWQFLTVAGVFFLGGLACAALAGYRLVQSLSRSHVRSAWAGGLTYLLILIIACLFAVIGLYLFRQALKPVEMR